MFGGGLFAHHSMFTLDEEGKFLEDFSGELLIPGNMCRGSYVLKVRKIYAIGILQGQ